MEYFFLDIYFINLKNLKLKLFSENKHCLCLGRKKKQKIDTFKVVVTILENVEIKVQIVKYNLNSIYHLALADGFEGYDILIICSNLRITAIFKFMMNKH